MFIKYLLKNFSSVFGTWIFLTMLNQLIFFGSCLRPDCILASIPHVSIITLIVLYSIYNHEKTTYDVETGYNGLGFNKEGYDSSGYNEKGYDRDGFNLDGYDVYGKDRKGKGFFGRLFTGNDYAREISKLNKEAISANQTRTITESKETLTSIYDFNSNITKEGGSVKSAAHSDSTSTTKSLEDLAKYKAELKAKLDAAREARV